MSTYAIKKTSTAHWRGRGVRIKIKHLYPCFIAGVNYGYRTRDLVHTHPNSYQYYINAIKHGYRCFIS